MYVLKDWLTELIKTTELWHWLCYLDMCLLIVLFILMFWNLKWFL